jgi:hypothetical protein
VQTVADGAPDSGGVVPGIADDTRHLVSLSDDYPCEVTAELARQLAERARASRFRRYRDRMKQLATRAPHKRPTLTAPPSLLS